jgi:hypothetical protein
MEFRQQEIGQHRIYAVALDSSAGGYTASVEVRRLRPGGAEHAVVWRNEELFALRIFNSANEALCRALDAGHTAIGRMASTADAPAVSSSSIIPFKESA